MRWELLRIGNHGLTGYDLEYLLRDMHRRRSFCTCLQSQIVQPFLESEKY